MAWRPPYHPQFGHTTWGSLAWRHCGHTLRGGADSRQFEARRLRLLALEVFFLGTAIFVSFALVGAQRVERRPSGVHHLHHVPAVALVAVRPTFRAQTQAVLIAERGLGQLEQYSVARQRRQVDLVASKRIGLLAVAVLFVQLADVRADLARH